MPNHANANSLRSHLTPALHRGLLVVAVLLLAVLLFAACKEKNVPYADDSAEILRCLNQSYEGQMLFSSDSLILPDPYKIFGDTATYVDSVLDDSVLIFVNLVDAVTIPGLGTFDGAVVAKSDLFTVRRSRLVNGTVTDTVVQDRQITRYGVFAKLGSDAEAYLGWKLFGFNGVGIYDPTPLFTVMEPDQSLLRVDPLDYPSTTSFGDSVLRYVRLDALDTVALNAKLVLQAKKRGTSSAVLYELYSGEGPNGIHQYDMIRLGTNNFVDTLQTPAASSRRYSLILIQSFLDAQDHKFSRAWCVAYQRNVF